MPLVVLYSSSGRLALALVLALVCVACASAPRELALEQALGLQPGMRTSEVEEELGEPSARLTRAELSDEQAEWVFGEALLALDAGQLEYWQYTATAEDHLVFLDLVFVDDRLLRNQRPFGSGDLLGLEDGMTWRELMQLLGPPQLRWSAPPYVVLFYSALVEGAHVRLILEFEDEELRAWSSEVVGPVPVDTLME